MMNVGAEWRDVVCPGNTTEKCLSQMHGSEVLVVCVCKPGYFGEKCQLLWNPCDGPQPASQGVTIVSAPHKSKKKDEGAVCVNEGVCHPVYLHGTKGSYTLDYMCDCLPGYTGKNCEVMISHDFTIRFLFAHDEVNVHCSPAKKVFFPQ